MQYSIFGVTEQKLLFTQNDQIGQLILTVSRLTDKNHKNYINIIFFSFKHMNIHSFTNLYTRTTKVVSLDSANWYYVPRFLHKNHLHNAYLHLFSWVSFM